MASQEALAREGMKAYHDDGTVPWKNREVLMTEGRVLLPGIEEGQSTNGSSRVKFEELGLEKPIDEMRLREMPEYLQNMLLWLYESGGETEDENLDE